MGYPNSLLLCKILVFSHLKDTIRLDPETRGYLTFGRTEG